MDSTPTTRDFGQEIDDLSHVVTAFFNSLHDDLEAQDLRPMHGQAIVLRALARVDEARLELEDVHPEAVEPEATTDPRQHVVEHYAAMADELRSVIDAGRAAWRRAHAEAARAVADPDRRRIYTLTGDEAEAYLAWRRSVTGPLRFQSGPLAALMVAITEAGS